MSETDEFSFPITCGAVSGQFMLSSMFFEHSSAITSLLKKGRRNSVKIKVCSIY